MLHKPEVNPSARDSNERKKQKDKPTENTKSAESVQPTDVPELDDEIEIDGRCTRGGGGRAGGAESLEENRDSHADAGTSMEEEEDDVNDDDADYVPDNEDPLSLGDNIDHLTLFFFTLSIYAINA